MQFALYQLSHQGGRRRNEDRVGYSRTAAAGLFAVADGMGGHPEGDVAAQTALQCLTGAFERDAQPATANLADPAGTLQAALLDAHVQLLRYAQRHALGDTPRTTAVALVLQGDTAWWAHCGDSRLYLLRAGKLFMRTLDHSYIELGQHLVPRGSAVPNRSVLFTCLGASEPPAIASGGPLTLAPGDIFLLCSDGLWSVLDDADIAAALPADEALHRSVPALVAEALRRGGSRGDNVTALAVRWESSSQGAQPLSTLNMGDAAFASTIEGSLGGEPMQPLSDAEIERSVREINEAIARAGTRR